MKKQINELNALSNVRPSDLLFVRDASDAVDKQYALPSWHPASAESGTFTPVFTCATPGDLSVTYNIQTGRFRRYGDLVIFRFHLNIDVTHSTASGGIRVTGLPYDPDTIGGANPVFETQAGNFDTWAGSSTARFMVKAFRAGTSQVGYLADGPGLATAVVNISDVVSPKSSLVLHTYGQYTTAAAFA